MRGYLQRWRRKFETQIAEWVVTILKGEDQKNAISNGGPKLSRSLPRVGGLHFRALARKPDGGASASMRRPRELGRRRRELAGSRGCVGGAILAGGKGCNGGVQRMRRGKRRPMLAGVPGARPASAASTSSSPSLASSLPRDASCSVGAGGEAWRTGRRVDLVGRAAQIGRRCGEVGLPSCRGGEVAGPVGRSAVGGSVADEMGHGASCPNCGSRTRRCAKWVCSLGRPLEVGFQVLRSIFEYGVPNRPPLGDNLIVHFLSLWILMTARDKFSDMFVQLTNFWI